MLISMGDIAFGGAAVSGLSGRSDHLAISILSLSHIVTRVVLSDRLVFFDDPKPEMPGQPTAYLRPAVLQHCNTVQIHYDYAPVSTVFEDSFEDPKAFLGAELISQMEACVRRFVPWASPTLTKAWLSEFAAANAIAAPFAPNPFISEVLSIHSLKGRTSADELTRYVEDLRRETSEAMNTLKGLKIYDLQIPAIFAAVLRESRDPSDVVRVASQMNVEAKAFRDWCRSLDAIEHSNPKKYLDQLHTAMESLRRLGRSLSISEVERMQVSMSSGIGIGIDLPSSTLKKLVDFLDVDLKFIRPRSFLLNLLSSARQVHTLSDEVTRVFKYDKKITREAGRHLIELASQPSPM